MRNSVVLLTAAVSAVSGFMAYDQYDLRVDRDYIVMERPGQKGEESVESVAARYGELGEKLDGLNGYLVKSDKNQMRVMSPPPKEYIVEPLIEYKIPDIIKTAAIGWGCNFNPFPTDPPPPPTDDPQVIDWGVERVGSVPVLDTVDASAIRVCVLDTGIDKNHPDLSYLTGKNFTSYDAADFQDRQSHGTHTAGLVAATHNSFGVVGASQSQLLIGKVLGDDGSGYNSWIGAGIVWCVDSGADIISMSLGGPSPSDVIASSLGYAASRGVLVYAAAGNDGSPNVGYPAGYEIPGILFSISATNRSDRLAYFSNYGKVEAAAPGVGILSTVPGGYESYSGTSMATPIAAGVAALYLSVGKTPQYDSIGSAEEFGAGLIHARGVLDE